MFARRIALAVALTTLVLITSLVLGFQAVTRWLAPRLPVFAPLYSATVNCVSPSPDRRCVALIYRGGTLLNAPERWTVHLGENQRDFMASYDWWEAPGCVAAGERIDAWWDGPNHLVIYSAYPGGETSWRHVRITYER